MKNNRIYIIALILGLFLSNANAQDGEALFKDNCTACHKIGGKLVGPDLVGVGERRTDDWIKSFITNSKALIESGDKDAKAIFEEYNKTEMTSFQGSFTDEELGSIVEYIKSAKPPVAAPAVVNNNDDLSTVEVTIEKPMTFSETIVTYLMSLFLITIILLMIMIVSNLNKYLRINLDEHELQNTPIGKLRGMFVGSYTTKSEEGHEYDGIRELDNTMPPWLQGIFYLTIIFAIGYLINFQIINPENTQEKEYQDEMAMATAKYGDIDVVKINITQVTDQVKLVAAKDAFISKCAACHLVDGGGSVGPNLTDEYWLNGGSLEDVFHTIREGVPAKGMISWKGQLSDEEILNMASYIKTLKGTTPAKVKDPQGDKYEE